MEDVTDPPFRSVCKELGADMIYTEFISSDGIIRGGKKGLQKLKISDEERPIGIQLYGQDIDIMLEAAKIAESFNPDLIDLNFGCPVKKISNRGAGAGLLKDIPKMIEMTKKIVDLVKVPVTAKTRLGWDHNSIVIEEVSEKLQDAGISALTIHARTRSQLYTGIADWSWIGKVKNNPRIKIPVIGNGDIDSVEKAKEMFEKHGVDGVMIGRAAIAQPWIFSDFKNFINKENENLTFNLHDKINIAKKLTIKSIEYKGNRAGVLTMRRHFAVFFKNLSHFKELRISLLTADSKDEVFKILDVIEKKYS